MTTDTTITPELLDQLLAKEPLNNLSNIAH